MPYFNIVAETNENTVVTEYEPLKHRSDQYQSEADLEKEFIRMLCEQGYEYLPIHTEEDYSCDNFCRVCDLRHNIFLLLIVIKIICCSVHCWSFIRLRNKSRFAWWLINKSI